VYLRLLDKKLKFRT